MPSILITGCSSGIGLECATQLHNRGWDVHATARNSDDIGSLENAGMRAYHLDYADAQSIKKTFDKVLENTSGRLDAVFHNGAYGQPGALEDLETNTLRAQFEANFFGWHELTRLCLGPMRAQGHGRIVFCSSILGWIPAPWRGAYNASKFAVEGYASTLRLELRDTNIKVSLIEPGPIATRFSENALEKFLANVKIEGSPHFAIYQKELKRLEGQKANSVGRFTLPPEAVYRKLEHALSASSPRAHYGVTVPTHFMNVVRRILPQPMIDWIIMRNT